MACGQTAQDIVNQMLATYRSVQSLQLVGNAETYTVTGNKVTIIANSSRIIWQPPNHLLLVLQNPIAGSTTIASDGSQVIVYYGLHSLYRRYPAPSTPQALYGLLSGEARVIEPIPDNLLLALEGALPPNIGSLTLVGSEKLNGSDCSVVKGSLKMIHQNAGAVLKMWIDKQTHLLMKISLKLPPAPVKVLIPQKNHHYLTQTVSQRSIIREWVVSDQINQPIPSKTFDLKLPKGAILQTY